MRWGGQLFAREAEIMDIPYDLDKDQFRILIFDRNIYKIVFFKYETIILYIPQGSIYFEYYTY